jgi:hypothetical protein
MNGSPKGDVTVHVYATQNADKGNISTKYDKNTEKFDVEAVYGGGNLAAYEPTSSTGSTRLRTADPNPFPGRDAGVFFPNNN